MLVSIIIPVLNEGPQIAATLDSLRRLRGATGALGGSYEVVVVDGGSEDDTVAVASRFGPVLHAARGRAQQMNAGAKAARGDVFLFLHADTLLPPGALKAIGNALADPRVIGGRFRLALDGEGLLLRLVAIGINLRDRLVAGFTGDQAIFLRRDTFWELGGYNLWPLMEDLDLGRRMARRGKVARLPLAIRTSARRWQKDGVARTVLRMWLLRYAFLLGISPQRLHRFYGDTR